jgi:tRNA threonylcarbamoyl adenosine modification protein YeaZ
MLILAFDTTSPDGSAVLLRDGEPLGEVRSEGKSNYSVALFEMVDRVLGEAGVTLDQVELFAAATGPGSFTGIRVGLAAAQAWATAFGRQVSGVSVLEAMVEGAQPQASIAVPLLDARRNEYYLGVFQNEAARTSEGAGFLLAGECQVLAADAVSVFIVDVLRNVRGHVSIVSRECDKAVLDLRTQLPTAGWIMVPPYLAGPIARVALRAAAEGRLQQPQELDALYIRRSDAEINWSP